IRTTGALASVIALDRIRQGGPPGGQKEEDQERASKPVEGTSHASAGRRTETVGEFKLPSRRPTSAVPRMGDGREPGGRGARTRRVGGATYWRVNTSNTFDCELAEWVPPPARKMSPWYSTGKTPWRA